MCARAHVSGCCKVPVGAIARRRLDHSTVQQSHPSEGWANWFFDTVRATNAGSTDKHIGLKIEQIFTPSIERIFNEE